MIDLRSDTVTKPTKGMLEAMVHAEVGDDGYGEDPTVNKLERLAASLLGKEAALFVTSGTQGNQIAILTYTNPGDEVIVEQESHIYLSEKEATATLARVKLIPLPGDRGQVPIKEVKKKIEHSLKKPSLISIETTHGRSSGTVLPLDYMKDLHNLTHHYRVPLHLDGARLFNAAKALKVDARVIAQYADSVSFCLSKGLGAPVGSVLVGTNSFIKEAREWRKRLGGRMRQAGFLAAAGIYALNHMWDQLEMDHLNAKYFAEQLGNIKGLSLVNSVDTNIVLIDSGNISLPAENLAKSLKNLGVLVKPQNKFITRLVVHKDVKKEDLKLVCKAINETFRIWEASIKY